jgi:hypothetical protein
MATREIFRYSWIKVSDEDGRAEMMRAALDLQPLLAEGANAAQPGSAEAAYFRAQTTMARAFLGGDLDHGIRVIILSPAVGGSLSLDVLASSPHAISRDGIEITVATMPSGYSRADAEAWLQTPVGSAWSKGALACRLAHAVVTADVPNPTTAPTESQYA